MPRRLGQHFLIDTDVLRHIAEQLDVHAGDIVVEIGPGHGELTDELLDRRPAKTVLIEKDTELAEQLRKKYAKRADVSIHEGDVRDVLGAVVEKEVAEGVQYKIVGNIPYYLTGYLLRLLGELPRKPGRIVLTMQKEVAERMAASAPDMNKLAASVQFWADAEFCFAIPAAAFDPPPEVDSATAVLVPHPISAPVSAYFSVVKRLFAQPRKTIANNLSTKGMADADRVRLYGACASLGIDPQERPQNLTVSLIAAIAKTLGA